MKQKRMKKILLIILIIILCFLSMQTVFAAQTEFQVEEAEYTDEYKQWMNLSDEEKSELIQPRKYKIQKTENYSQYIENTKNLFKIVKLVGNASSEKYNLKDIISDNMKIRDQQSVNDCWAFASVAALETSLALKNHNNSIATKIYDYSERHMDYATVRDMFNDEKINEKGYSRKLEDGGYYLYAESYLTNASGAVEETLMPFEDNINKIDIEDLNQTISTTLYDTVYFENVEQNDTQGKQDLITKVKSHISNYGGIYAAIATPTGKCFNETNSALYVSPTAGEDVGHAVTIVGWDDTYAKENFNEEIRPTNNGAWIAKNSYGETWGKEGYLYISYEDVLVYQSLWGIEKATDSKDYYNTYQHDELGASILFDISANNESGKIYLANVFDKDVSVEEALNKISFTAYANTKLKVYVNRTDKELNKSKLREVSLAEGDTDNTITINPGYHVIEFENPINLTGNGFAIMIEVEIQSEEQYKIGFEAKYADGDYKDVVVNQGESYMSNDDALESWVDCATNIYSGETLYPSNLTIKAYTQEGNVEEEEPKSSNFENAKAEMTEADMYFYTDETKSPYVTMNIQISNIVLGDKKNEYTYYYYIAGTRNETDIADASWIEISKENLIEQEDGTYILKIDVDSRKMETMNLDESSNSYLYVKEVAKNENTEIENINVLNVESNQDAKLNFYLDDEEVGTVEDLMDQIQGQLDNFESQQDGTTANRTLPNAGVATIAIVIAMILILGAVCYYRYNNIDK